MNLLTKTILALAMLAHSVAAFGWGEKGHNVVAHIAQRHLTPKTEREVKRLLDGHNMAYWSKWADDLRGDPLYDFSNTWHYANAEGESTYAEMTKNPAGDVYTAVNLCVEQLTAKGQSDSLRTMYLRFLIHFIGDMHCPMHAGKVSDEGGNRHPVVFMGTPTNLHRIWDSPMIDVAHAWSSIEWAYNIDFAMSRTQRQQLQAGAVLDWMEQTVLLAKDIYANSPQDADLSWDYVRLYSPPLESQLLKGGYRLARVLNGIFDPKAR
jgi:hypothetical protein